MQECVISVKASTKRVPEYAKMGLTLILWLIMLGIVLLLGVV